MAPAAEVRLEIADDVATLRLARPQRRNSFTEALMEELLSAVETATRSPARVILITGDPHTFSVGGDLDLFAAGAFRPAALSVAQSALKLRRFTRSAELLRAADQVSIAAVAGACAGAGLGLAAACDLRVAATNAVFRTSFLDAGLASDFGAAASLVRLLGEARAKQLFLLNEKLSAEAAERIGLVSWIASPADFDERAVRLAATLAAKAPLGLRNLKRGFAAADASFAQTLDREARLQAECFHSDDAIEAANAFLQRRMPHFHGR